MRANTVGVTVTSPPYCTRIDYAVASRIELAILGYAHDAVTRLRSQLIGTPITSHNDTVEVAKSIDSHSARRFIDAVSRHSSKASATYYSRYFIRYFREMQSSIREIHRVTKFGGVLVMVIQDSYYKEIRNDVAASIEEISDACGWALVKRTDFPITRTKAIVHPGARKYRSSFSATESVLTFHKKPTNGHRSSPCR